MITDKTTLNYFLNIEEKDVTRTFIIKNFGFLNEVRKYDPQDTIIIPAGKYGKVKKNTKPCKTTLGIWVFNKYFIEDVSNVLGYINEPLTQKLYEKLDEKLSFALNEDKITAEQLVRYEDKYQFFLSFIFVLSSHYSENFFRVSDKIRTKKKKLIKENKEALEKGDFKVSDKIEKELTNEAINILGPNDEGLEQFKSGAKGSIDNHFKNIYIMKGAIKNIDPVKGFDVGVSSYMDGISKDEYVLFGNSLVAGVYAKSNNTAIGGYWVKLFIRALQHVVQSETNDCHTDRYIDVALTDGNIRGWIYGYIIEGTKLVELTTDNMNKYIGKKVKMRYSSMCECKDGICQTCSSTLFKRIGITKIGMTTVGYPNTIMQKNMKKFHDSTIRIFDVDVTKIW
jgi:hypothetical protein